MRRRSWTALCFVGGLIASCSGKEASPPGNDGPMASVHQRVTDICQTTTFQQPCDPDGPGPLTNCQGVCMPDPSHPSGKMACFPIEQYGLSNMDGRLCGDATYCSAICAGTQCANMPAPDGTPCRPSTQHDKCAGACVAGTCQTLDSQTQCPYGRTGQQTCDFLTCDPLNAFTCIDVPLEYSVACDDGDPLTTGEVCNGCGECTTTGPGECLDAGTDAALDGAGGTGGSLTDASTDGSAGSAGTSGSGGSATGGTGGDPADASTDGTAGSSGSGGSGTGGASTGGSGGSGTGGASTGGSGGSGTGGASTGGTGGSGTGGASTGGLMSGHGLRGDTAAAGSVLSVVLRRNPAENRPYVTTHSRVARGEG